MSTSGRTEQIGQPATQLSRTLASIHHWQQAPGMNPQELLMTLDRLIAERLWEGQTGWDGKPMTLARALTESWPVGVGMTDDRLERLYDLAEDADVDPELVRRVKTAVDGIPLRKPGRQPKTDGNAMNHHVARAQGTPNSYLRRRLYRDHRELYERVLAGELSTNAAAVEAGIRPRRHSVSAVSPEDTLKAVLRVWSFEQMWDAMLAYKDDRHRGERDQ